MDRDFDYDVMIQNSVPSMFIRDKIQDLGRKAILSCSYIQLDDGHQCCIRVNINKLFLSFYVKFTFRVRQNIEWSNTNLTGPWWAALSVYQGSSVFKSFSYIEKSSATCSEAHRKRLLQRTAYSSRAVWGFYTASKEEWDLTPMKKANLTNAVIKFMACRMSHAKATHMDIAVTTWNR